MLNVISDIKWRVFMRMHVCHSLPGRLRLRLPAIAQVPERLAKSLDIFEQIAAAPAAILEVRVEKRTASVLILYDNDRVTEADVVRYIESLIHLLRNNVHLLDALPDIEYDVIVVRLSEWLRQQTHHCPALDPNLRIPDAIWAED